MHSDTTTVWLTTLSENNYYCRLMLKQYLQTCKPAKGNQILLLSSISAVVKNLYETLIESRNGAKRIVEDNVEVSSRHSATQGSKKEPSQLAIVQKATD